MIATFFDSPEVISSSLINTLSTAVTNPFLLTVTTGYEVPVVLPNTPPPPTSSPDCGTPSLVFTVSNVNWKGTFCVPSKLIVGALPSPSIEKSRAFNNFVAVSALPLKAP